MDIRLLVIAFVVFAVLGLPMTGFAQSGSDKSRPEEKEARSCLLSVNDVKSKLKKLNAVVIDVRKGDEYESYTIAGSLNMPAYEIYTKSYLKHKVLILVGYGYDNSLLTEYCNKLRGKGFRSVYVLRGGIVNWAAMSNETNNGRLNTTNINYITPADLLQMKAQKDLYIINLSGKGDDFLRVCTKNIVDASGYNQRDLWRLITRVSAEKGRQHQIVIIVIGRDNVHYTHMSLDGMRDMNAIVFFLSGGMMELLEFEKARHAILTKKEFHLQEPKSCAK